MNDNLHSPQRRLIELRMEHADLDSLIDRNIDDPAADDLSLRRLKKRRLVASRPDRPTRRRARPARAGLMADDLWARTAAIFDADGPLARSDPNYTPRPAQLELARSVCRAIDERSALVAEAGTGVGKTFAYLVPLLLSGGRALVSTATKSLQDQLFLRDLPRLVQQLGVPVRTAC
jgi:hypothetical protein